LKSRAVVLAASGEFTPTRKHPAQQREIAEHDAHHVSIPVLDLPAWSHKETTTAIARAAVQIAFDPLVEQPDGLETLAYLRLPGPSGYRSRYDATALDRVVDYCAQSSSKHTFVAFRNIDRFENARYVMTKLGIDV